MNPASSCESAIWRQIPGAIWVTDRDLRLTFVCGQLLEDLKLSPAGLVGTTIHDFVGNSDPGDPGLAPHLAALQNHPQSFEYHYGDHWLGISVVPLRDSKAGVHGVVGIAVDITEQRTLREKLRASEARLAEAQRVANIGSFEWDMRADSVWWSDELYRIYGIQEQDFAGKLTSFFSRIHPDDEELVSRMVRQAVEGKRPLVYDHRIVRPDGTVRILHTQGKVILNDQGEPTRLVGSCWDITDLRQATSKLEESNAILQATLDATADGILVTNNLGEVVTFNKVFLRQWGVPEQLVATRNDLALVAFVMDQLIDPEAFLKGIRSLYADPERRSIDLLRFKDGRVYERTSVPQLNHGDVIGRVWSFHDVTYREKEIKRTVFLSDSSRILSAFPIETALEHIAISSVPMLGDAVVVDMVEDEGMRRLVSVSPDPARPFSPVVRQPSLSTEPKLVYVAQQAMLVVPIQSKRKIEAAMTFRLPENHEFLPTDLTFVKDLADRIGLAFDTAQLVKEAQDAVISRDEFLSIVAHEIRGPLTTINLAAQSVLGGRIQQEGAAKFFEMVVREVRRLSRFVEDLLQLGKFRAGKIAVLHEQVNLEDIVNVAVARLEPDLKQAGSALVKEVAGPIWGNWDRERLEQVLLNLLSNAIKFGKGKPIRIKAWSEPTTAFVEVLDHGIGIPKDDQGRIFAPFERAVSVRHFGGLGLGLYIVRTIVEQFGGKIRVESTPEKCTAFTFELPLKGAPSA